MSDAQSAVQAIDVKVALSVALRWMNYFSQQGLSLGGMLESDLDYVQAALRELTQATLYKDDPLLVIVMLKTALGRAIEAGIVEDGTEPPAWQVCLDAYLRADGFGAKDEAAARVPRVA